MKKSQYACVINSREYNSTISFNKKIYTFYMTDNKTMPTNANVTHFISDLSLNRQNESKELIEIMSKISKLDPVMWGPSIIGFGSQHYKYDSGREGDMPILSF
jgi:hypothetical protein